MRDTVSQPQDKEKRWTGERSNQSVFGSQVGCKCDGRSLPISPFPKADPVRGKSTHSGHAWFATQYRRR